MLGTSLDKMLRIVSLYDLYGELLTERQREFVDLHYMKDLSLGEISEQYGISRQAVHDALIRAEAGLEHIEGVLGVFELRERQQSTGKEVKDKLKHLIRIVTNRCDLDDKATAQISNIEMEICKLIDHMSDL